MRNEKVWYNRTDALRSVWKREKAEENNRYERRPPIQSSLRRPAASICPWRVCGAPPSVFSHAAFIHGKDAAASARRLREQTKASGDVLRCVQDSIAAFPAMSPWYLLITKAVMLKKDTLGQEAGARSIEPCPRTTCSRCRTSREPTLFTIALFCPDIGPAG